MQLFLLPHYNLIKQDGGPSGREVSMRKLQETLGRRPRSDASRHHILFFGNHQRPCFYAIWEVQVQKMRLQGQLRERGSRVSRILAVTRQSLAKQKEPVFPNHWGLWALQNVVMARLLDNFHPIVLIYSHFKFSSNEDTGYLHYTAVYLINVQRITEYEKDNVLTWCFSTIEIESLKPFEILS